MSNMKAGDVGVVIQRTLVDVDGDVLSVVGATLVRLDVIKTGGTAESFTGELTNTGSDGKVEYTTEAADFVAGHYQAQFYVEVGISKFHSDRFHFDVDPTIV